MFLKYLIPFDRFTIDSPVPVDEVVQRLRAVTVKRHWFRYWRAVPGTFEGRIRDNGFTVLTSAEGFQFFGWARTRNASRPVCVGRITPSAGGSRISVRLRLQWFFLLLPIYFSVFLAIVAQDLYFAKVDTFDDLGPTFLILATVVFGLNYALWTWVFWVMRNRARAALARVLTA